MRFSSHFRSCTATLGAIVLLSACQSSGIAPPQGAGAQLKPAPGAIWNNVPRGCFRNYYYISPSDPKIKPGQKVTLTDYIKGYLPFNCKPFGPVALRASWQSSGGHLILIKGKAKSKRVEFWASKPNVYTIYAQAHFLGPHTYHAQDTVTVQK
jgi:hypothetical protein